MSPGRVKAPPVVPADPLDDRHLELVARAPDALRDQLGVERIDERLAGPGEPRSRATSPAFRSTWPRPDVLARAAQLRGRGRTSSLARRSFGAVNGSPIGLSQQYAVAVDRTSGTDLAGWTGRDLLVGVTHVRRRLIRNDAAARDAALRRVGRADGAAGPSGGGA